MNRAIPTFPFSALVGQQALKRALLLTALVPEAGGVLLRGEKGTAKSTAARALAELLPGQAPFRTLPLGATEDRLSGGLDLERTLVEGRPVFQPGLLAEVHGGVLYVDEVNLLDDHLVDQILSASACGEHRVEREGLAVAHPSRFALIGTMNPEEGNLRPQLLDRFAFCVDVEAEKDPAIRVELLEARMAFEADAWAFTARFEARQCELQCRLSQARDRVPHVRVPRSLRAYIAEVCRSQEVAGHRADLVLQSGAMAHAAWEGRLEATTDDVLAVLELALTHRRRDALPPPPPPPPPPEERPEDPPPPDPNPEQPPPPPPPSSPQDPSDSTPQDPSPAPEDPESSPNREERVLGAGDPFRVKHLAPQEDRLARKGSGRRQHTRSADRRGRYVRSRPAKDASDLALDATLRAAAIHQKARRGEVPGARLVVRRSDWQTKVRERRTGSFILFVVDASGSMGARSRMIASKGAVLSLLLDAYQKRDKVALVSFRRREAQLLVPPTASIDVASRLLRELPVGGRTPLAAGLVKAHDTLRPLLAKEPSLCPLAILVSDGRANAGLDGAGSLDEVLALATRLGEDPRVRWVVVDTEDPRGVCLGHARKVAAALQAEVFAIEDLRAQDLVNLVKGQTP